MRVLEELEPKKVFSYFEDICNIPHPSYHEKQISDYLVNFAKEHGLEYYQDDLYNVIMIKEATPGYENVEPIILQGHMDMVAEKTADCTKDMLTEGLDLKIDGDYISAKGTTLGGDDGIAVAYALAILDDESLEHPRLEVIITVSEEVGMEGAAAVDLSMLRGHRMINIDSEQEDLFLTSCAGGCRANVELPIERECVSGTLITVAISGLLGGHSGTEINCGRANADVLAGRMLREAKSIADIYIVTLVGGGKDNAIPRECTVSFLVDAEDAPGVCNWLVAVSEDITKENQKVEENLTIVISSSENVEANALTEEDTDNVIGLLQSLPNGVQAMSQDIEGLVETSLNLGIMELTDASFILRYAIRSSKNSAKEDLTLKVQCVASHFGAETTVEGMYPAWEYKADSTFRETAGRIFEELYGYPPEMNAIHAGLECGLFAGKIANLDAISIGPNMQDIHTTEERLSISSTKRMYDFVVALIAQK